MLISREKQCGNHFKTRCKDNQKMEISLDFMQKQPKTYMVNPMQTKNGVEDLEALLVAPKN